MYPRELRYSKQHVWIRLEGSDTGTIGVTQYAQDKLGEVLAVELPLVGAQVQADSEIGSLESVKTASSVYSPVSGEITEVNEALIDDPAVINRDPYGAGWIARVKVNDASEVEALMGADQYQKFVDGLIG